VIQPVAADCLSGVLGDNSQICAEQDSCKVDSQDCQSPVINDNSQMSTKNYACQSSTVDNADFNLDHCVESILHCPLPQQQYFVQQLPASAVFTIPDDTLEKLRKNDSRLLKRVCGSIFLLKV